MRFPQLFFCLSLLLFACGCGNKAEGPVAKSAPTKSTSAEPVTGNSLAPPSASPTATPPVASGAKYIPRVSEKKLQDFFDGLDDATRVEVTDEQVFAIMGEPTRRGAPVTGQKNGQALTVYEVFWEEAGSGVKSNAGFMNGRLSGMALGIEIPKP